jgi:putative SOS response-associated peptidase YedK
MSPQYEFITDPSRLLASCGVALTAGAECSAGALDDEAVPVLLRTESTPPGTLGELRPGRLGLLPRFATDTGLARHTVHCRTETMKSEPAFRESWWAGRRTVVAVARIAAWRYDAGRPELWDIQRADADPLLLAGLWNEWTGPGGEAVLSFSLLTLAATGHAVFGPLGAPDREPRMPVILPTAALLPWLAGSLKDAQRLLQRHPAEALQAAPPEQPPVAAWREPKSWAAVPDMFAHEWHAMAAEPPRPRRPQAPRTLRPQAPEPAGPTTADLF